MNMNAYHTLLLYTYRLAEESGSGMKKLSSLLRSTLLWRIIALVSTVAKPGIILLCSSLE